MLIYGGASGIYTLDSNLGTTLGNDGAVWYGAADNDLFGGSVLGIRGGSKDDGYDDFIIGAPNAQSSGIVTGLVYFFNGLGQ